MIKLYLLTALTVLYSCSEQAKKEPRSVKEIDSLLEIQKANYTPPVEVFKDTVGVAEAPVKIISAKLVKDAYSNYKDLQITYKNVSGKDIDGIRFHWITDGVWGQEDIGRYSSLSTDDLIRKNKTHTKTWGINSKNKKVYLCWPFEVVYSDGTRWKLNN